MDTKGYYAMLGVSEKAKYNDIRAAYRRLAKMYHPDVSSSISAEETIKKINEAFEVLSDKEKRRQYDKADLAYDNTLIRRPKNEHPTRIKEPKDKDGSSRSTYRFYSNPSSPDRNRDYYRLHFKPQNGATTDNLDSEKSRFHIVVEPSLCMAFGSCETLAPKVFVVEKNKIFNPKANVVSETAEDFESILSAAQTCPTKAIIIIDRHTGERIYPV